MSAVARTLLHEQFRHLADVHPDREFLAHGDRRWTWAEAATEVGALTAGFRSLGVRRGDRVATWIPNGPEWSLVWLAVATLGAALVPVNTRYKADEAAYVIGHSQASVLVVAPDFLGVDYGGMVTTMLDGPPSVPVSSSRLPALRHVVAVGTDVPGMTHYPDLLDTGGDTAPDPAVVPTDDLILVYTSGTTGFPKGARHAHATLSDVAAMADLMGVGAADRILAHMPFFHVGGSFMSTMTAVVTGAAVVTVDVFTGESALRGIERERCTVVNGVPSHFVMILAEAERVSADVSSARVGFIAGAMIPPEVVRGVRRVLGMDLITMYGMTETTGVTTATRLDDPDDALLDTVGRPIADDYEVVVVDPATDEIVGPGVDGEIRVRGHRVMSGYHGVPASETFRPGGWFPTGDLGRFRDDGRLQLTGRLKDMFIVGGTNVFPAEIEAAISQLDAVAQVHVVGIPDERLGEVGMAFVALKAGGELTGDDVVAWCRERLANYKVPRLVSFVTEFPMTATGKIQKYRLRDAAVIELGLEELAGRRLLDRRAPQHETRTV